MKKILLITIFLFLVSCGTPGHYHSIPLTSGGHKASAVTWDGGWGISKEHPTVEAAVFAALRACMGFNYTGCEVDMIDNRYADLIEKREWTNRYNQDSHKYEFTKDSDGFVFAKLKKKVAKKTQKKKKESNSTSQGSSGSAFFISSKGDIITNNHVIEGCRSQPKVKYKNKDVTANIVATDKMLDLALLKADLRNTKYISFSKDEPKKLQRIIVAGYPFGQYISDDLKFTSGIVSSLKGPGDDSTLVQVDAALNVGNSGGPIVDESSGQLVAVSVLTMDKSVAEGQNFGIKTSSVKNFLNANKVKVPFGFNFNRDVAESLEKSTLYVYCY